jgi:hypothetical protein
MEATVKWPRIKNKTEALLELKAIPQFLYLSTSGCQTPGPAPCIMDLKSVQHGK